ncbi:MULTISPECIES: pheST operon leader peptide PheM [Erwinia]|uniref:pheST attenuator peptide n=1 Tax=Erwinia pyrifoliae TaxID=79967 RepID=A0ABY5XDX2_ERWPY|nr:MULTISPECIES: pheST operon leader peptide PheM [Erwinia]MCT2387328.1 pheST operon leader peptide PheM [Erwinia pyrifoliae]MCU8587072.1 pheST operon leader peptide PheM [Erwinia pyrifoliae]UWS31754.1 pheST operon leader peptide PheM [Erwinia pyrifoliae]UWS35397.1 pheST operon leader peptide PheM [Erwinia pyrifoliae]UXK14180.1 pheST operon leader peptide PheM [Erwinia pyrifoliae]
MNAAVFRFSFYFST